MEVNSGAYMGTEKHLTFQFAFIIVYDNQGLGLTVFPSCKFRYIFNIHSS